MLECSEAMLSQEGWNVLKLFRWKFLKNAGRMLECSETMLKECWNVLKICLKILEGSEAMSQE